MAFIRSALLIIAFNQIAVRCGPTSPSVSSVLDSIALNNDGTVDYYWKDFNGIIPRDAIPGGVNKAGEITYIGQMYRHSIGLLPATIERGSKSALASSGGASFTADQLVKILCGRNLNKYQWMITKNEYTHLLTNCHLVVGGKEAGFTLNIGRVNHEMETIVGKVFANHTPQKGLTIPTKHNNKEATYQAYEILTYNCNLDQYCGNFTTSPMPY